MIDSLFQSKGGTSGSVIGVDIGTSSIKAVQLKKEHGKAVLETYGALSLGPYGQLEVGQVTNLPPEKIAQALIDLIREAGISTMSAGLSIPSASSLIFTIEIPSLVPEKEYPSVVPTEARRFIPVPISEVSLDWWPIPQRENAFEGLPEEAPAGAPAQAKSDVLVVAIHNDALAKYGEVIKKSGITALFFEIETFSNIRANFNRELSAVLVFEMGASKTKLSIVEYGIVRQFHAINKGSQDITNALLNSLGISFGAAEEMKKKWGLKGNPEDANVKEVIKLPVDYIFSESENVVLNYEKKYNKVISKVILTGGGVLLKGLKEKAAEVFNCEVVMGSPFDKVEAPAFLAPTLSLVGPEFATALGLALRNLQ